MEDSITESLKSKKIDRVIVPGGCTKYIQAPDVSWNKPFKSSCTEKYDEWLGTIGINEETAAGNLRALPRRAILQWILYAWAELPTEVIKRSFTSCALNLPADGSNDDIIYCFKEGQPAMQHGESYASDAIGYLEGTRCKSFRVHRFRCGRGLPSHTGARRF